MNNTLIIFTQLFTSFCYAESEESFTYEDIAKRHTSSALSNDTVAFAKMQGECLVGLKDLNFKKTDKFDPVAEWTNFRSYTLLEQYSPCEVLLIMEVARQELKMSP